LQSLHPYVTTRIIQNAPIIFSSPLCLFPHQDLPLPALFNRAEATLYKLKSTPSPSQTQLIHDALTCLDRASALVDSLGLFSSNEDKDDLTTGVIKYLLIPYYKAEILAEQHQNYTRSNDSNGDTDSALLNQQKLRLESLKSAQTLHENFLLQARQYDVLSAGALKCIFGVVESTNFSSVAAQPPKIDAATLRELKIEKFKLEKSVAARVSALSNRLSASEKNRNEEESEDTDDEAAERELQILRIEASALKSIESLRSIRQEIDVLRHATNLTDKDRRKKSTLSSSSQDPQQQQTQEMLAELRKAAGALKLGQEAVHRDSLRQAVFQPTVQLPTLTVEQQGDIEVAQILAQQRIEAEKAQKVAVARAERGRKADDSEEDDEFEGKVYKQRAMDDWKDENPRGWGNSKMKPCG
jgi:immunoglobulin-binding protein 1